MTDLQELMALLEKATPDWRLQKYGVVVGGPFLEYQRGNAQSQLASFMAMYRASAEECDQEANAAAAVAAVNFLRSPAFAEMARDAERLELLKRERFGITPIEGGGWDVYVYSEGDSHETLIASYQDLRAAIDAAASGGG